MTKPRLSFERRMKPLALEAYGDITVLMHLAREASAKGEDLPARVVLEHSRAIQEKFSELLEVEIPVDITVR